MKLYIFYRSYATMEVSLADLPPHILSEILSRLPIKSLLVCRSVCKTFLNITSSNPYFNSLYSSNSSEIFIVQSGNVFEPAKFVHLVDSELDTAFGFDEEVQLKPMFQIPKYPGKYIEEYSVYVGGENNFTLVNSCNGLLCFAERNFFERSFICNPITKEYVTLVELDEKRNERQLTVGMWFGFSPGENKYKVLRIFTTVSGRPWERGFTEEYLAQIHVVGSSTWRDIEDKPPSEYLTWGVCSSLVNGSVYWLCRCQERSKFIILFDFEKEKFGEIRPPVDFVNDWPNKRHYMRIGVLRGRLCVAVNIQRLDVWVMEENCSRKFWTRMLSIETVIYKGNPIEGPLRPLKILSNGNILMLWFDLGLVCYDPEKKNFQMVHIDGVGSLCKSVLLSPSFVPLKEALMIDNVTVQNLE